MNNQTWKVGNRNLNVDQMRAYRRGEFDPQTMKYISVGEPLKHVELPTQPNEEKTSPAPSDGLMEDSVDVVEVESPLISELEENQKMRKRFDELKEISYQKLDKAGKDEYKKLKDTLDM